YLVELCRHLRLVVAHLLKQLGVVPDGRAQVRMLVAGGGSEPEEYLDNAAHQRLGLGQPVRALEQQGQVVEVCSNVGMVRAEALLVNRQRSAHQRLSLRKPVGLLEQPRQVVKGYGDVWMVRAEALHVNRQGATHKHLGLRRSLGLVKQMPKVVQAPSKPGIIWNAAIM